MTEDGSQPRPPDPAPSEPETRPRRRRWLAPRQRLAPEEVERGLRYLLYDGVSTQVMGALTGGALLVGYALLLGASNKVIGVIAAIGPLTQLLQLPSILLVERIRRRKALVMVTSLVGRSAWVLVALLPLLVPAQYRIAALLSSLVFFFASNSLVNAAYNSWKRDLVPDAFLGRYLARRLTAATAAGAAVTLASGFFVDHGEAWLGDPVRVYLPLFLIGSLTGILGVGFLGRVPEPQMSQEPSRGLVHILSEPVRDLNFRKLLVFLASWNFAINLAAPFFAVYMLTRLELPMAWVLGLSVVSQVANVLFFRVWGRIADRLSNKVVLSVSGTLFVVSIALWPFTTLPGRYVLTVPLLLAIHVLAGISTAGVNLCAGAITLKLAPRGKATAFLATNAVASGAAATLAPLLAGLAADWLAEDRLALQLQWSSPGVAQRVFTALDLQGLDFVFVGAVLFGLYALHRLLAVEEEGEIEDAEAAAALYGEMRRAVRHVSNVAGLRRMSWFPFALLRWPSSAPAPADDAADEPEAEPPG